MAIRKHRTRGGATTYYVYRKADGSWHYVGKAATRWLAHEPVTGGMLFPNVDGVARDVVDRRRWPQK